MSVQQICVDIYKRTKGRRTISWMVRRKDPATGKWKATTAGKTKFEAETMMGRVRELLLKGLDPAPKSAQTLENESIRFEQVLQITNTFEPAFKGKVFDSIRVEEIKALYSTLLKKGLSYSTIKKYHFTICQIGDIHCEVFNGKRNPGREILKLSKLFPKQASTRDINFLTEQELELVFKETDHSSNALLPHLVRFLATTGMRRSKALNLKWTDIDQNTGFILIRKSKTGRGRSIPLERESLAAITPLASRGEFVFTYVNGRRPHADSFLTPLKEAAKGAGIEKRIDLHTLRHSFASNKIRANWPLF